MNTPPAPRWRRALLWAAAVLVLGATSLAYRNPTLMVDLASRVWACF